MDAPTAPAPVHVIDGFDFIQRVEGTVRTRPYRRGPNGEKVCGLPGCLSRGACRQLFNELLPILVAWDEEEGGIPEAANAG